jgi:hypothetical protein
MRTPNYPVSILAEAARAGGKIPADKTMELVTSIVETHRACSYFEGQVYSLTYERDRLKAENEFLIRLFNVKQEEFDGTQHTAQQHDLCPDSSSSV